MRNIKFHFTTISFLIFILPIYNCYCQNQNSSTISFLNQTLVVSENSFAVKDTSTVILFNIISKQQSLNSESLKNDILLMPGILSCKIFYDNICKLEVSSSVSADAIRNLLIKHDADFDPVTVSTADSAAYMQMLNFKNINSHNMIQHALPCNEWIYPESYPTYINTGNPVLDDENFAKEKQRWILNHPDEYKKMTGLTSIGKQ